ncbi:MAG: response regulator transcription factor [Treponema sp.]|jgi:DNA-binding response OmpR family regulator|nr:response regulator transcription factor [Treponema sp.]
MGSIAIVDDETNIRKLIRLALEKDNHRVREYPDGLAAWEKFRSPDQIPDLIILDILMPRMDGLELCRKIRSLPWGAATPIIFLSSKDEEIDKVLGLESGGDDYVSKPFSLRELLARVRAGLRRSTQQAPVREGNVSAGAAFLRAAAGTPEESPGSPGDSRNLLLDEDRLAAVWKGRPVEFTVTEFRILQSLCLYPGFIKTREQLMAAAFPEDNFPNDKAADSHIKRIRRKFLEQDPDFNGLESVYGLGYRWRESGSRRHE